MYVPCVWFVHTHNLYCLTCTDVHGLDVLAPGIFPCEGVVKGDEEETHTHTRGA